jgi:LysR family glycine cleavage system transcriptional activator
VTRGILIEEEIRPGQLLELFSEIDTRGFYIIKRPGVLRPQVRAIVTWLKRRAGAEMTIRS